MTTCPKCGYVRKPAETLPDWQCPACGIAYAKFHAAPAPVPVAPPPAAAAPAAAASAEAQSPMVGALVGAAAVLWGAGMVVVALDFFHPANRPRMPDPVFGAAGLFVGGIGYLFIAKALDFGERAQRVAAHVVLLALAAIFTMFAFAAGIEALQGMSIGPLAGGDLVRIASVAFDLYVVSAIAGAIVRELRRTPDAPRYRLPRIAGAIVLAPALHLTGTLDGIYTAFGTTAPGPIASRGVIQVWRHGAASQEMPLEAFAGDWRARKKGYGWMGDAGPNWLSRAEVRVADGKASARLWRPCPPQECEAGTFPAIIESRHRGRVQALHFIGTTAGMDWVVSLVPQGKYLVAEEQHSRGGDINTRRGGSDVFER